MPAKWIDLFNSYGDAYDYTIKIKKIKDTYKLYFLQIAPDFDNVDEYTMFSDCERVLYGAEINNGAELVLTFMNAAESDNIIRDENPGIEVIIEELAKYPFLKKLYYQVKEANRKV